tara:strand:- start:22 stop:1488 length:1467 start_codon:yes stop_codon:yes gene_type:complete
MSINKSYFSKNNTITSNSFVNTGRNPVTELFFGRVSTSQYPNGYSRFIFDLDMDLLMFKVYDGTITTGCTNNTTHTLNMTNTSTFDLDLLNTRTSQLRLRSTSFDLILFRIPNTDIQPYLPQVWDEGVGYDFADLKYTISESDKNYSVRPSNWFETTTIGVWTEPGIYNNKNNGVFNYNNLTIVDTQHFEFGNENIKFDMTNEINSILDGSLTNVSGWGIAYNPQVENLTGLTDTYEVQFFTRHTQTFYEPYLETTYDDLIQDDRNNFSMNKVNKLYLYLFDEGRPVNLDTPPTVDIMNYDDEPIAGLTGLTSCQKTKGVYEVTIPPFAGYSTVCSFSDKWYNMKLNNTPIPEVTNEFVLYPFSSSVQIGTNSVEPELYGFDFYGLKQDEKILSTDVRRVGVIIKQAYTTNKLLPNVDASYRVYVKEGQTEVQVQDWTKLNRTPNDYYFVFDTRDKIPNEYFVDIKVESSGEINTYKREIKFQVVNVK